MNTLARTTAGEERLRLWKKTLEFWPPYAEYQYQLKTEREFIRAFSRSAELNVVMAGLVPAIHVLLFGAKDVDARHIGERSDAVLRTAMASPSSEFLNHKRH